MLPSTAENNVYRGARNTPSQTNESSRTEREAKEKNHMKTSAINTTNHDFESYMKMRENLLANIPLQKCTILDEFKVSARLASFEGALVWTIEISFEICANKSLWIYSHHRPSLAEAVSDLNTMIESGAIAKIVEGHKCPILGTLRFP